MTKECQGCGYRETDDDAPFTKLYISDDTETLYECPYCQAVAWAEDVINE